MIKILLGFFLIYSGVCSALEMSPTLDIRHKLEYSFNNLKMSPNQVVELKVPDSKKNEILDFIFLTHKQDPNDENECRSNTERDCLPAYTSLEVARSENGQLKWYYWGGHGSGPYNSKFAELRSKEGETDNLYEWYKKGYIDVLDSANKRFDPLVPAKFRIRNVGPDDLIMQKVVVKYMPDRPANITKYIFSNELDFGDWMTAKGRQYPRSVSTGNYGDALYLSHRYWSKDTRLSDFKISNPEKGTIEIPIVENIKIQFVDIACGDMKPVPKNENPENYRGNGKLTVIISWGDGTETQIIDHENVGSNGVMRASSFPENKKTLKNAKLIIKAHSQIAIMGIQIGTL